MCNYSIFEQEGIALMGDKGSYPGGGENGD
jgi:hypothetical protein